MPVGGIRQHASVSEGQPRAVDACAFAVASRLEIHSIPETFGNCFIYLVSEYIYDVLEIIGD